MGYPVRLNDGIAKTRATLEPLPQLPTSYSRVLLDLEEQKVPRVAKEITRKQEIRARSKFRHEQSDKTDSLPSATEIKSTSEDLNARSDQDDSEVTPVDPNDSRGSETVLQEFAAGMRGEADDFEDAERQNQEFLMIANIRDQFFEILD